MHFFYRRTIRLKQETLSCNNKTNCTRRHQFITHKNNCSCQVFSRSCNDQPLFVNEYKFKVGWQSSFLKKQVFPILPRKTYTSFQQIQTILHYFLRTCEYFNFRWTLRPFTFVCSSFSPCKGWIKGDLLKLLFLLIGYCETYTLCVCNC